MKKGITILSRRMFFDAMNKWGLNKENVEQMEKEGLYIISINDPKGWNEQEDFTDKCLSNVLTMEFGDIRIELTEEYLKSHGFEFKVFDYDDAHEIKSFIEKIKANHPDNFQLIIHCHAGVSRSAAVGLYAWQKLGLGNVIEFEEANPNTAYNPIIYNKLKEITK